MKLKGIFTAALVVAMGAVAISAPAQAKLKRVTIGSNPSGSVYFLLAGAFAKLFQEKMGVRATAQPHAGSSVYLPLMDRGEITLGLNSSLDSGLAYGGKKPYKRPMKGVRSIARIWILPYGYIVKESSGIKSVEDLRGKRVVVNVKTNVSLAQLNRTILATAGMTERDVKAVDSGGVVAGVNMVVEGRADAATGATGMPVLRKSHATVPGGLRMIALGAKATDKQMNAGMAGARTFMAKPSKRMGFIRGVTKIAAFDTYLNAGTTVKAEDAYLMAKTMHSNWKAMQKDYGPLRGVRQDQLVPADNPIPYHAGAVKYYKEVGLWTAANQKHQATLN